MIDRDDMKS